jgi:replicative DNA helicase
MADLKLVRPDEASAELFDFQKEMIATIEKSDQYAWSKDKLGGFSFGDWQMDKAFNGIQPHMYIIAGSPNIGKSALALQMGWQAALANEDLYVIYYSLDDMSYASLPRVIAMDRRLDIDVVTTPKRYTDDTEKCRKLLERREEGYRRLKSAVDRFKMIDRTELQTLEAVEKVTCQHKAMVEQNLGKKLAIFVDALDNLEVEKSIDDKQERRKYVSRTLKDITEMHQVPVIATTHLKKLNGHRRPIADDIKETNDLQYDAYAIILCYSEIGIKGQTAKIFHEEVGREERLPVLEGHVIKNKLGEFKNRMFWEFFPGNSFLQSATTEGVKRYNTMIQ